MNNRLANFLLCLGGLLLCLCVIRPLAIAHDNVAHGYLLSGGEITTIDFPGAAGLRVLTDIDPAGRIVGRYRGSDGKFYGFSLIDEIFRRGNVRNKKISRISAYDVHSFFENAC